MKEKGITLIEMIITISIIIVVLVVGVISLSGFRKSQVLENQAKEIVFMLKSAQNKSVNQECNSRWGVTFDNPASDNDHYFLYKVDNTSPAISGCDDPANTIIDEVFLKSEMEFSNPPTNSSSTIIFSKATGLPSLTETISIFREGDSHNILINTNGKLEYQ